MTDIPIPEDRLRQFLDLARALGSISITRTDTADRIRLSGHHDLAAQVEAEAVRMARKALSAVIFLEDVLAGGAK